MYPVCCLLVVTNIVLPMSPDILHLLPHVVTAVHGPRNMLTYYCSIEHDHLARGHSVSYLHFISEHI